MNIQLSFYFNLVKRRIHKHNEIINGMSFKKRTSNLLNLINFQQALKLMVSRMNIYRYRLRFLIELGMKLFIWPRNHISHTKVYFNEFVANVLRDDMGSKKIQPPNGRFFKKNISNWDFNLEISHLRKKVFILTSKM